MKNITIWPPVDCDGFVSGPPDVVGALHKAGIDDDQVVAMVPIPCGRSDFGAIGHAIEVFYKDWSQTMRGPD